MKFVLTIDCNNAAFDGEDARDAEIVRILGEVRRVLMYPGPKPGDCKPIHDINGNRCGQWALTEEA